MHYFIIMKLPAIGFRAHEIIVGILFMAEAQGVTEFVGCGAGG